jgi:hypothetical protein
MRCLGSSRESVSFSYIFGSVLFDWRRLFSLGCILSSWVQVAQRQYLLRLSLCTVYSIDQFFEWVLVLEGSAAELTGRVKFKYDITAVSYCKTRAGYIHFSNLKVVSELRSISLTSPGCGQNCDGRIMLKGILSIQDAHRMPTWMALSVRPWPVAKVPPQPTVRSFGYRCPRNW